MEYSPEKKELRISKGLNYLDRFVIEFTKLLGDYVIVSGYVSILLGRSRATEDVDLLIPEINLEEFRKIWYKIHKNGFECLNTNDSKNAFNMLTEHAIRFSKKGRPLPNMEFKIIKNDLDRYSYENRIKVLMKEGKLWISPLEMQIAYKLFLAAEGKDEELISDKDIEDARHLYKLFEGKINKEELASLADKLEVNKKMRFLI